MGYFPVFMEMKEIRLVIAGGGAVALRKVRTFLPFGCHICVIAPEFLPELEKLEICQESEGRLLLIRRPFECTDIDNADLVIAATSDKRLNQEICSWCREKKIPVNSADGEEYSSFLVPSIIQDGPVCLGISTGGNSPVLARILKQKISSCLPKGLGAFAVQLGSLRERVKEKFQDTPQIRRAIFKELTETGMKNGCYLSEQDIENIIERKLEEKL